MTNSVKVNDLVKLIAADRLEEYSGSKAVVLSTPHDRLDADGNSLHFGLAFPDGNRVWWFNDTDVYFIESNRSDLVEKWERQEKIKTRRHSSYGFIADVLMSCDKRGTTVSLSSPTFNFIWKQLDIPTTPWGSRGEGFTHYMNYHRINMWFVHELRSIQDIIKSGNKAKLVKALKEITKAKRQHIKSVLNQR